MDCKVSTAKIRIIFALFLTFLGPALSTPIPCEGDGCEVERLRAEMEDRFAAIETWMKDNDNKDDGLSFRVEDLEKKFSELDKDVDSIAKFLIELLKFLNIIPENYETNSRRLNELGLLNGHKMTEEPVESETTENYSQTTMTTQQLSTENFKNTNTIEHTEESEITDVTRETEEIVKNTEQQNTEQTEGSESSEETESTNESETSESQEVTEETGKTGETETSETEETTQRSETTEAQETTQETETAETQENTHEYETTTEFDHTKQTKKSESSEEIDNTNEYQTTESRGISERRDQTEENEKTEPQENTEEHAIGTETENTQESTDEPVKSESTSESVTMENTREHEGNSATLENTPGPEGTTESENISKSSERTTQKSDTTDEQLTTRDRGDNEIPNNTNELESTSAPESTPTMTMPQVSSKLEHDKSICPSGHTISVTQSSDFIFIACRQISNIFVLNSTTFEQTDSSNQLQQLNVSIADLAYGKSSNGNEALFIAFIKQKEDGTGLKSELMTINITETGLDWSSLTTLHTYTSFNIESTSTSLLLSAYNPATGPTVIYTVCNGTLSVITLSEPFSSLYYSLNNYPSAIQVNQITDNKYIVTTKDANVFLISPIAHVIGSKKVSEYEAQYTGVYRNQNSTYYLVGVLDNTILAVSDDLGTTFQALSFSKPEGFTGAAEFRFSVLETRVVIVSSSGHMAVYNLDISAPQ